MAQSTVFANAEQEAAYAKQFSNVPKADFRTVAKLSGADPTAKTQQRQGVVGEFVTKAKNIATQVPKVIGTIGKAIGGLVVKELSELPGELYRTGTKVIPTLMGQGLHLDIASQNKAVATLEKAQDNVVAQYKAGRMTKEEYGKALSELSSGFSEIAKTAQTTITKADPNKAVEDFVDTAAFLFTMGSGKLASAAPRATQSLANKETVSVLTKVNLGVESALKKLPGDYFTKILDEGGSSAAKIVLQNSIGQNAKLTASKLLIKYPLTYHTGFDDAGAILGSLSRGDLQGAAGRAMWNATALLSGPIGAAYNGVKKLGISSKLALFGKNSFFDELSSRALTGDRAGIMKAVNALKETDPARYEAFQSWGKSLQAMNLFTARDDVRVAVDNIEEWFYKQGTDLKKLTAQEIFDGMEKYGKAMDSIHKDLKLGLIEGIPHDKSGQVLLGRFDRNTRNQFIEGLEKAGAPRKGETIKDARERMLKFLNGAAEEQVAWTHNEVLFNKVKTAIEEGRTVKKISEAIQGIDAGKAVGKGWTKETRKLLNEGGYVPVIPKHITGSRYIEAERAGKIVTSFADKGDELFDTAVKPLPGLDMVGKLMKRAGLSAEDTGAAINQSLNNNLDDALKGVNITSIPIGDTKSKWIKQKLSDYMESLPVNPTVTKNIVAQDARFLRTSEIAVALGVDTKTARTVQKAILDSYTSIPLAMRGLGDKLVDYSYNIPVTGALQRAYSRVQGALRYSWNPFFRLQETTETELLSQMLSGGKVPQGFGANGVISLLFKKTSAQIDDTVKKLANAKIFSGTLTGQGAEDAVIGRITANMTKNQKKSLAGFALKIAEKKGMSVDDLLNNHYDEVADALRVVVQYPRKGGINSPLARTLNIAFFPARYNIKVAGLAADTLAKAPPAVQMAMVNGIYDFSNWLKSDEGTEWQSKNQDALQLFKWITPYNSIEWAMKRLTGGMPESIGDLGLMGGLPFGLITQMLDSQTSFELNTPYVNMKNGEIGPEYTPATDKARAATALQDLIGMAFNYPGRLLGLPGKAELIRKGVDAFVDTDTSDYTISFPEDRLTGTQKKQVEYLKSKNAPQAVQQSNPVFDGYSWNESGYYIPVDVIKKTKAMSVAPVKSTLPSKKAKSGPKPKKIARPIENR